MNLDLGADETNVAIQFEGPSDVISSRKSQSECPNPFAYDQLKLTI